MMKSMIYLWLMVFTLVFTGCGDFLEPSSSDEFVPENAASLDEMLVGDAYPDVAGNVSLFFFHNALDDDMMMTRENVGFIEGKETEADVYYGIYTLQPDLFGRMGDFNVVTLSWVWDDYYKKILGANAALDYVDDVKDVPEMKGYVKAQALGLRAFYYFNLVNLFGAPYTYDKKAPGVPLKLTSNLSTDFSKRNSVEAVYGQVLEDLGAAEKIFVSLPEKRQFSKDYRMNLPTVQLLKSRVHLFMGEWENAIRLADSVLAYPRFKLYDLTGFVAEPNIPKPHYSNYDNGESMWHYGSMGDLFGMAGYAAYSRAFVTRYLFNASDDLLSTFVDAGDLRKELYVFDEYYNQTKLDNKKAMGKVLCNAQQIPLSALGFGLSVRLSEAYLILAEAHAMLGNTEKSMFYLNELRAKRIRNYSGLSGLTGDDLIRFVRAERRRELCFEGTRWFDLRRWGMESFSRKWRTFDEESKTFVIRKNDPAFTLPIPQKVIERNPGLEQNPLTEPRTGI